MSCIYYSAQILIKQESILSKFLLFSYTLKNVQVNLPEKIPELTWNVQVVLPYLNLPQLYLKITGKIKGHHLNFYLNIP